jgi:hypothetical protein
VDDGARPAPAAPPSPPEAGTGNDLDADVRRELNWLRQENDRLRDASARETLAALLTPLLDLPDDPGEAVARAQARFRAPSLARDLLHAVGALIRSDAVEWVGRPAQVVDLRLPHPDYRLDGAVVAGGRDLSRGRFRVLRRGLRYKGVLLTPAAVAPLEEEAP